jgi:predicted MFS family arabinose efflux permease
VVAGGWASGYLGDHFGWQSAFQVLGTAGLALALAAWFWLRDTPLQVRHRVAASPFAELAALLRVRTYLLIISEAALVAFANLAYMNWLPLYFRETFDMTLAGAGFSGTFLMQFPAVLGAALGGVTSDRVARREKRARLLLQSCCYMIAAPLLLVFSGSPPLAMISVAIFSFGLLRAIGSANENPMLCDLLPPNVRSTAVGLMNATSCLAGGIGIFVAGYLKSAFGLGGVFAASSVLLVLASAILAAAYRFQAPKDLAASSGLDERVAKGPVALP